MQSGLRAAFLAFTDVARPASRPSLDEVDDPVALDQELVAELLSSARLPRFDLTDQLRRDVDEEVAAVDVDAGVLPVAEDLDRDGALRRRHWSPGSRLAPRPRLAPRSGPSDSAPRRR